MRQDKGIAFKLRKEGKTYRQIQEELGISKSTLCDWFKNEEWSKHIKNRNANIVIKLSTERIQKLNIARSLMLKKKYEDIIEEGKREYEIYKKDTLFIAGLMLYAGEGDHLDKGSIRFANVDFDLHRIFINFSIKYFKLNYNNIKFSILLYPDLNIEQCLDKWCFQLGIYRQNIYKPQVINGKHKTRKLHFGVGTSIILNSFLKRKLLFWINLSKGNLSK